MTADESLAPIPAHVWLAYPEEVHCQTRVADYEALLDDEERRRYGRFIHQRDAHSFLVSHALVRTSLSFHVPWVAPDTWRFQRSEHGRPFISFPGECRDWRFSLSHCPGLAACLIARHVDVGIDVEPVGRRADIDNIASHFFSSSEIELLGSTPQEKRQTVFMRLWTLKEAYLKARGTGLSTPLSHCVFDIRDENRSGVSFHQDLGDDTDQWLFRSHVRNQTHVMALAIRRSQIGQDFWIRTSVIVP